MKAVLRLKKSKGFVLLYAVLVASTAMVFITLLLSTITRQIILSSLEQNSEEVYYLADSLRSCAEQVVAYNELDSLPVTINVACFNETNFVTLTKNGSAGNYVYRGSKYNVSISGKTYREISLNIHFNDGCPLETNIGECNGPGATFQESNYRYYVEAIVKRGTGNRELRRNLIRVY